MFQTTTAIIGAGFMGPVHTEGLRRLGINVAGILGVDEKESTKAAKTLGLPRAYKSFAEVMADKSVQAVHITTPNRLHYEMAQAALKAGKHVLCEKPLAMNSKESAKLVDLAAKTGLVAGVNYNLRFYPLSIEAKNRVEKGLVGAVYSVTGSYVQDWLLYPTDYNWRVLAEEGGKLRAIADIGTHWLDLVQTITGLEVEAVCADLYIVHPVRQRPKGEVETFKGKVSKIKATEPVEINTDDGGSIMLRFKGGAKGNLFVSQTTAGRKNCLRYEIAGAESAMYWHSEDPNNIWLGHRNKANEVLHRDPGLLSDAARAFVSYPGGHNEGYGDTFKQCFKAFYSYIADGDMKAKPQFPTFADGHKEILLCEAILKSHQKGGWVTLK